MPMSLWELNYIKYLKSCMSYSPCWRLKEKLLAQISHWQGLVCPLLHLFWPWVTSILWSWGGDGSVPRSVSSGPMVVTAMLPAIASLALSSFIIPSFHPISVPFSPAWQCFCWYWILNKFVGLSRNTWGFKPPDKRVVPRFFLDNPISIPGFCSDSWLDLWITCLISLASNGSVSRMDYLDRLRILPNHHVLVSFSLTVPSPIYFSPLEFYYKQ